MSEKQWTIIAHIGTLVGYVVPFGNIIVPLVIYLSKKEESPLVAEHARESLNFQISVTLYIMVSILLLFVLIGFVLIPIVAILDLVCVIIATMKADNGEMFKYPATIRFV